MRVLVIEDNKILSRNIVRYFSSRDIHTEVSLDWEEWLRKAKTKYFDIIILDINLPNKSWLDVCRELREAWKDTAILMLTSMWTSEDVVSWLNIWADDYIVKPFEYSELIARMEAILRRKNVNRSNTLITIWDIELDIQKHEVKINSEFVSLSKLEFDLFRYLASNKWLALSRKEIYEKVWWEYDWDFLFSKTIDVYIWYLRKKFWKDLIETKKWYWYLIR